MSKWHVTNVAITPPMEQDIAVTVTTRYGCMCASNIISTAHYPMTAVIEYGYYEEDGAL